MRLIDAKELERQAKEAFKENPVVMGIFLRWIRKQPTIEAEPVRHGSWIEDGYNGNPFVCSHCGAEGCYSGEPYHKQYYYTNYCPHCGATMDKEG